MKTILSTVVLFICFCSYAQSPLANYGNLQIHNGTAINVIGDLQNTSTGKLINNGDLYLKGNISNSEATMTAGTGTLYLNGSSLQTINGTQVFKTNHLVTNNSAGFQLNNDLSIAGTHTFSSGIINTSATNFLIYENGASYTGSTDARHVNGWVKKIGSSNFTFPTGNGTFLRPVDLINLSVTSEFNVQYGTSTPNAANVQSPIVSVDQFEYWTINKISGGTAQVRMNWDNSKVSFPNYIIADLRTVQYSGSAWVNTGGTAAGSASTTGTITSNSLSSFGRSGFGSISFVIPVKFLGVNALRENASVKVNWKTATEIAVNFYEVQRSLDGINFTTIGSLPAKNLDLQSYEFLDWNAPSSKLYYRIKANDISGAVRHSSVVTVAAIEQEKKIELINNPVHSEIRLAIHNIPNSAYSFLVINAKGQVIKKGVVTCNGNSIVSIPFATISGEYTLLLSKPDEQFSFKFVVQ